MKTSNFAYLENNHYCSDFYTYLYNAEEYCHIDPKGSCLFLLCFLEIVVKKLYLEMQLEYKMGIRLEEKLELEEFKELVHLQILDHMQTILELGNEVKKSICQNSDCSELGIPQYRYFDEALTALESAHHIGYWFFSIFQGIWSYPKPFIKPQSGNMLLGCEFFEHEYHKYQNIENTNVILLENDKNLSHLEYIKCSRVVEDMMGLIIEEDEDIECFEDFFESPTNSQKRAIKMLKKFLDNPMKKIFMLKGYSGTGKTYMTKGLTDYFNSIEKNYVMAAPTGKAARVIQDKTGKSAQTIHKTIYELKYLQDKEDSFEFHFHHNETITHPSNTIFLVDEASMISNNYSKQEHFRFGTGKLLSDLLKFTKIDDPKYNNKIIFIGDNAQLPPVGMKTSPALSTRYIENEFNLQSQSCELVDVVRQKSKSGILINATNLRNCIDGNMKIEKLDLSYDDVNTIKDNQLVQKYLQEPDNSIIIAYSNKAVNGYNQKVREKLFPNEEYIVAGDSIIATANNNSMNVMINNGDQGKVVKVSKEIIVRDITITIAINEEKITVTIPLVFRVIEANFSTSSKEAVFEALIFENQLYRSLIYQNTEFEKIIDSHGFSDSDIERIEKLALYKDVVYRARISGINSPKKLQRFIADDLYFNSLKIKFGYSITCHKAQGSEWENVYLDSKLYLFNVSSDYLRWLYTAVTRASKKLFLIR